MPMISRAAIEAAREKIALEIWHRWADNSTVEWEDETHKEEYLQAADAILALIPAALAAEGLALVPVETSDELYKAVCNNGFVGDRSCFDSDYALIISAAGASDAGK